MRINKNRRGGRRDYAPRPGRRRQRRRHQGGRIDVRPPRNPGRGCTKETPNCTPTPPPRQRRPNRPTSRAGVDRRKGTNLTMTTLSLSPLHPCTPPPPCPNTT